MTRKLLDFTGARISDVKQINPLFSTCKVRILYTGKNRNMSIISKDAVEKALPSIIGVPIVGEFSVETKDFKGHGGRIDLDSYDFVHTTKPYGFVPQDATFSWEEVKTRDGVREYLTVDGCQLWSGRYPEVFSVVEDGKSQSMEIEVVDGEWNEQEEAYDIKNFIFSALCILGDDVEPAFEDANISASFSLDSDTFKAEYAKMMEDAKSVLLNEKEENMMLKKLLEKYSLTVEELTAKGIDFNEISEDELEAKIIEVFEIDTEGGSANCAQCGDEGCTGACQEGEGEGEGADEGEGEGAEGANGSDEGADGAGEGDEGEGEPEGKQDPKTDFQAQIQKLQDDLALANNSLADANKTIDNLTQEIEGLREFKLNTEKAEHEAKVAEMFSAFQLDDADVADLDIHAFSLEAIEEKCYAILGRKLAKKNKKDFNLENGSIRINIQGEDNHEDNNDPYGGIIEKYKNK